MSIKGERTFLGRGDRGISVMDERATVVTLAWLATHRDRLRTLLVRGKYLSLIVLWDREGDEKVGHDEDEGSPFEERVIAFLHAHGRRSADGTVCLNGDHLYTENREHKGVVR